MDVIDPETVRESKPRQAVHSAAADCSRGDLAGRGGGESIGVFSSFIFLAAFLVVSGWGLSGLKQLNWHWALFFPGLGGAAWVGWRTSGSWRQFWQELAVPLNYWPIWLVGSVLLLAAVVFPPMMHDSLSYRLPRLLFWTNDGYIHHLLTADERLNYMPPVWGLCALPLIQMFGMKVCWIWNFASWIACLVLFHQWAFQLTGSRHKARQISFLAGTSTFGLLQAYHSGNDLFAATFLLLSVYYVGRYEQTRKAGKIHWAILALVLATGVKPHFATLALPMMIWFWLAPSRPWRFFSWRWAALLLPVWLVCSPLLTFLSNAKVYGHWKGPAMQKTYLGGGPVWNMAMGVSMMAWQASQPSINPAALVLNEPIQKWVDRSGLKQISDRFNFRMVPINMVDNGSLGFLTTMLGLAGLWLVFKKRRQCFKNWPGWAAVAGVFGFLAAVSQYLPEGIGRSFAPFVFLLVPLVLTGWALFPSGFLKGCVALALVSSLAFLTVNPAKPLWPVQYAQEALERSGHLGLADKLRIYCSVGERTFAGRELLEMIPSTENLVAGLIAECRPLLPLMWPRKDLQLVLLANGANVADLSATRARYVLVSGGAEEAYPELCNFLQGSQDYELVKSQHYVTKLAVGPETWKLYCLKTTARN